MGLIENMVPENLLIRSPCFSGWWSVIIGAEDWMLRWPRMAMTFRVLPWLAWLFQSRCDRPSPSWWFWRFYPIRLIITLCIILIRPPFGVWGGRSRLNKIKINKTNKTIKWGRPQHFILWVYFIFWGAQPIKLTDRDSMIAKMHSCERSDHFVKRSRDLESLGHYGAYETENG